MNFHKTIGFLAALLLMLGLGVPDSFAQQDASKVTISVDKSTIRDDSTEPVTVTVTAMVTLGDETAAEDVTNVVITAPGDGSYAFVGSTIPVTVAANRTSGSNTGEVVFTMNATGDDVAEGDSPVDDEITITGTVSAADAVGSDDITGTDTITILDYSALLSDNATDASGFRVIIKSPGAGEWAGINRKVTVQLLRRANLASEWGNYQTIKVALRQRNKKGDGDLQITGTPPEFETVDEDAVAGDFYSLTVGGTGATERAILGTLFLEKVRTTTLTHTFSNTAMQADGASTSKVTYKRRSRTGKYDVIDFEFAIPEVDDALDLDKVYAKVTFTGTSVTGDIISSHDTETQIFPGTNIAAVGDGKFIKLDRDAPATNLFASGATTVVTDKGKLQNTRKAFVGRYIRTEARLSAVFRNHKVRFQLVPVAPADDAATTDVDESIIYANFEEALVGYDKEILSTDLFDSVDPKTVLDSVKVDTGKFKLKYKMDVGDAKKGDTVERDNLVVRVKVTVEDAAGNKADQVLPDGEVAQIPLNNADGTVIPVGDLSSSAVNDGDSDPDFFGSFILDSKQPKLTITYPDSAHHRFTEKISQTYSFLGEDADQNQDLNPLRFTSDEPINAGVDQVWVIIGDDTLKTNRALTADTREDDVISYTLDLTVGGDFKHTNVNNARKKKAPKAEAGQAGSARALKIRAADLAGNTNTDVPNHGVPIFDATPPKIDRLFPDEEKLEGETYNGRIGGAANTHYPEFRMSEEADSILVRYVSGLDEVHDVAGTVVQLGTTGENISFPFTGDNALTDGESYSLQVFVRDLAKNVKVSDVQGNLAFEEGFANPAATKFVVVSRVRTKAADEEASFAKRDSVVADQEMRLRITAQNAAKATIVTYNEPGVKIEAKDANDNLVSSVRFYSKGRKPKGVMDHKDGSATLDSDGWSIGVRDVFLVSEKTAGPFTVHVTELNDDGTVNIKGSKGKLVVEAADFQKLVVSTSVDGDEVSEVWGDFDLRVLPQDRYGNPSLIAFADGDYLSDDGKNNNTLTAADSLKLLGRRHATEASVTLYDQIRVDLSSNYVLEGLPEEWPIDTAGFVNAIDGAFSVVAPERDGRTLTILSSIVPTSVDNADVRSKAVSGNKALRIVEPTDVSITLWGPNGENWTDESDLTLAAGGGTVTFRAEGFSEGDMVTFTKNGEDAGTEEADADGYAALPVELTGSGTVTVKAALGTSSAEVSYNYEEQTGRVKYVDGDGNEVYIVTTAVDMEVGAEDVIAAANAFGTSEGEEGFIAQADVDGDGEITLDDLLAIASHWGRVAVGPATKPLVLAPGVNENAEFALSLGSERVLAGELVAVDVSLANVEALMGYGFTLNYDATKFEFISAAPADEDLLTSTGGEIPLFHHVAGDGQVEVATGMVNGSAISGGGDIVRFVFRVLYEFEDNARFEIANGLVFDPSQLSNPAVVAGVLELQSTPREFALHQNFPNPFNPDTTIKYDLAESADVTLQIYNVLGQVVRTLVASEAQNAGRYQIRWNGMDERGVPVSSGIYFYQIAADGKFSDVRKLMLLK